MRRLAVEQREEAGALAAHSPGLQGHAVEFGLLLGRSVLITTDLLVLGRIAAAAAIDDRQLSLEPRTHRIARRSLLLWRGCHTGVVLRDRARIQRETTEQRRASKMFGERNQRFRHFRPSGESSRPLADAGLPYPLLGASSRRFGGADVAENAP